MNVWYCYCYTRKITVQNTSPTIAEGVATQIPTVECHILSEPTQIVEEILVGLQEKGITTIEAKIHLDN